MRAGAGLTWLLLISILVAASASSALATVHQWSDSFGDSTTQVLYGLASDDAGSVVTTGYFYGSVDFGGSPLVNAGGQDLFVAKHASDGSHIWSAGFGDSADQYGTAVAVDGAGNIIVVGGFEGSIDFGGGPVASAGDYDVFVAKFSPVGVYLWSAVFGDGDREMPAGVAVDDDGNIFITGGFAGAIDFGGGSLTSAGLRDVFLVRLSPLGAHAWSSSFGNASENLAHAIALDGSGDPVIAGDFQGTINFGGLPLASAGSYDVFVAKFTAAGAHSWSQRYGDLNGDTARDVDLDSADQVLLAGYFAGNIAFSPLPPLVSLGNYDVFVAKLGATGSAIWSKRFGDASLDFGTLVSVDEDDEVLLAGYFQGSIDFGPGPLGSAGNFDIFLAKFDSGGNHYWSEIYGDSAIQLATGLDTDPERNVLIGGYFEGAIDLGGGPMASAGATDIFLAKLLPTDLPAVIGDRVWDDADGDGIQEAGETGMEAVPVYLYDDIGSLLDYTATAADGSYRFGNVIWEETYSVRFFPPIGYDLSPQDQGSDDERDSDADPADGFTPSFTLRSHDDGTRWDAGLVPFASCWTPDEPLYIYEMTLTDDGNDYPVLHFMDPNQPDQVTGYNVYRSSDPGLPHESWSLVASNVIDMDEATPNQQWVDTSGDPGDWYYQVAAYNHHCPPESAEGPW